MLTVFLGGCGGKEYCAKSAPAPLACELNPADLPKELAYPLIEAADKPINILVLSGGGSNGAWGAGVLNGWRRHPTNPRPEFRVVTGISTGALQATSAFLNTAEDDKELEKAYTTIQTEDIYRTNMVFTKSLMDSSPLKKRLQNLITEKVVDRVATERAKGRRLYIGTTNLAAGRLTIWDMTEIALMPHTPARLELFRKVILASASIPVLFPPVEINGQLHADGGTRAELFFQKALIPMVRAAKEATDNPASRPATAPAAEPPAASTRPSQELRVYVIVNGTVGVNDACVRDNVLDIAKRGLTLLLDAANVGDLYRVKSEVLSAEKGAFFLTYIPLDFQLQFPPYIFDKEQMGSLYKAGFNWAKENAWHKEIPETLDLHQAQ